MPSFRVAIVALTLLAGCATSPVGVHRMDARSVQRSLTTNVLTAHTLSLQTTNVLHRRGLYDAARKRPEQVLAELHRVVLTEDDNDTWFALAELSFLHAEDAGDRRYAIMSAIYAWSFLFGGQPPEPFDPRLRVAADLYNRGLTVGLDTTKGANLSLGARSAQLPIGQFDVSFDASVLEWNGRHLQDFIPVAELEVHGLAHRFRTPGIGAPLAASAAATNVDTVDDMLAPRLKTPVTALVKIDDVRRQIASGHIRGTLELYTDPNEAVVSIDDRQVPLEKDTTAALASMLAEAPVIRQEIEAFLGRLTGRLDKGLLVSLRPHVRGRTPVVFVHGTASSPARWAEMVNVLDNDPRINQRYEPWFFAYNSSSPIVYSAYLLRQKLTEAVDRLDPAGTDTQLRRMVVIGHSQGGLLTKMTAIRSGDAFWKNVSNKSIDEARLSDENRELLRKVMFVEPLPFVSRVVFVCTPHQGSFLAASGFVRGLIQRLISLPATVTTLTASALTLNPDFYSMTNVRTVNAIDNMSPNHPFIRRISSLPVAPEVTANSIIAVQTDGPIEAGNDGVVEYKSAHVAGVESEKVVRSNHSTQAVPETIEEVRRILLLHAAGTPQVPVIAGAKDARVKGGT